MIRALLALVLLAGRAIAAPGDARPEPPQQAPLPAPAVSEHTMTLPSGPLAFGASVSVIRVPFGGGQQHAEVVTTAYTLDGADPRARPVTFAFNGGPGSASIYLHLGAMGPWRVPLADATASGGATPVENAETWLPFTDLVFIDAPGTGFSRIQGDDAQKHFWSVDGDVQGFAATIRRWLDANGRYASPVYIAGESYGGIRAPRLIRRLAQGEGIGVSGLLLISPLLDYGGRSQSFDPLYFAARLPSEVAAARDLRGQKAGGRGDVADAEAYALGEYLTDEVRGYADPATVARTSARLAALTGLDEADLRRAQGRIAVRTFLRDVDRAHGRVGSVYDATFAEQDAFPASPEDAMPDAFPERVTAPLVGGLRALLAEQLHWQPEAPYRIANEDALHSWDFGGAHSAVQSMSPLRTALAVDPKLRVAILHGLFDLQTPYLGTAMQLSTIAPDAGADRVSLRVVPGGHMFYTRDASRAALRDAARELIAAPTQ